VKQTPHTQPNNQQKQPQKQNEKKSTNKKMWHPKNPQPRNKQTKEQIILLGCQWVATYLSMMTFLNSVLGSEKHIVTNLAIILQLENALAYKLLKEKISSVTASEEFKE
jgi:hypothetical protein